MADLQNLYAWALQQPSDFFTLIQNHDEQFQIIQKNFDRDYALSIEIYKTILDPLKDVRESSNATIALFNLWKNENGGPSLIAMISAYLSWTDLHIMGDERKLLLTAALLASFANNNPYHSHIHYKKVVVHTMRLIHAHNNLFATNKDYILNQADIMLLLTAACIHDLGHDGLGNTVQGIHKQSRLEQGSIDLFAPFIQFIMGAMCKIIEPNLTAMILATDVTPLNDPASPMAQMKSAYKFHFLGGNKTQNSLHLDEKLKPLQSNKKLALLALLLHEADLATSAGLNYETTSLETIALQEELGTGAAKPSDIVSFMQSICQRRFITDAGQKLYSANLARIYAIAQQAVEDGDHILTISDIDLLQDNKA